MSITSSPGGKPIRCRRLRRPAKRYGPERPTYWPRRHRPMIGQRPEFSPAIFMKPWRRAWRRFCAARGPQLRSLALGEDSRHVRLDDEAMDGILRNIADESQMQALRDMIARVDAGAVPQRSAGLLRRIVAAGRNQDEKTAMQKAMDRAIAAVLSGMEPSSAGSVRSVRATSCYVEGGVRRGYHAVARRSRPTRRPPAHAPRLRLDP